DPGAGDAPAAGLVQSRSLSLTIVAQDPAVTDAADGRILRAKVRVPATHLEPGPRGARFHMVDFNSAQQRLTPPVALLKADRTPHGFLNPRFLRDVDIRAGDARALAQNVYAIAARTLELFESSLGRRMPWAFAGHQLYIVPRAFPEANAYYDRDQRALL